MPETPDFDQIAKDLAGEITAREADMGVDATTLVYFTDKLRSIWNARGAADGQAVERRVRELVAGEIVGAGIARHVADAITTLDR